MKKKILSMFLIFTLIFPIFSQFAVQAAIPNAFYALDTKYQKALKENNHKEIVRLVAEIEKSFVSQPLSKQKAEVLAPRIDKAHYSYEKLENYDKAVECLKKYITYANFLGWDDGVKLAKAKLNHLNLNVSVYAQTSNPTDIPYFGAINEPKYGTYFGRTRQSTNVPRKDESALLFYVEFFQNNISDFESLLKKNLNGNQVLELAWNMPKEAKDLEQILLPKSDEYIKSNLKYLSDLESRFSKKIPILLRIGGEMNVWTDLPDPKIYKSAYIKIAKMAREYAPNVALVFSPNITSNWNVKIEDYYPGDAYVDWVGVSLYSNKFFSSKNPKPQSLSNEAYYANGNYANPIVKIKNIVDLYGHKKPIMISEGAVGHSIKGSDINLTDFAISRIKMMYSYINMVFPQVKCIMYFDTDIGNTGYNYTLAKNQKVNDAYSAATTQNIALVKNINVKPKAYTKLGNFKEKVDTISLNTYCVLPENKKIKCEYYIDGVIKASTDIMPYTANLDVKSLSVGGHRIKTVVKSQGTFSKILEYDLVKYADGTISCREYKQPTSLGSITGYVLKSDIKTKIAGKSIPTYNVNDSACVMVSDLKKYGFDVSWNGKTSITNINANGKAVIGGATVMPSEIKNSNKLFYTITSRIQAYIKDRKINAHFIEGKTIIAVKDLEPYCNVVWNGQARSVDITFK